MKKHFILLGALLCSVLSFSQTPKPYKWSTASTNGSVTFNTLGDIGFIDLEDIVSGSGGFKSISFDGVIFDSNTTPQISIFIRGEKVDVAQLVTELKKPSRHGSTWNPNNKSISITDNATPAVTKTITINIGGGQNGGTSQKQLTSLEQQELIATSFREGNIVDNIYTLAWARGSYDPKNNLVVVGKTVHVFLDEFGNTLFSDFPTTAREDYNYSFHIFYTTQSNTSSIKVEVKGLYNPTFEIYNADALSSIVRPSASGDNGEKKTLKAEVKIFNIEKKGPFTSTFSFNMKKIVNDEEKSIIPNRVINIAPVHHISLMVGLVGSYLSNPTNIEKGLNARGDSTLFANDPNTRGLITLMAVFYPKPRNLLFPPQKSLSLERLGIVVGTRIDSDLSENFFGGLSYDLARGLSITGGIHYGRVNVVAGHRNFNFGEDTFSGDLITKKEWQANWFIGVNIDLRVFGFLFNPQGQTK